MAVRAPSKKNKSTEKKYSELSKKFTPRFIETGDQRSSIIKELRNRYEQLKVDAGVDSYQKDIICRRAIFIAVYLETQEVLAAETGQMDFGSYAAGVNALSGLLTKLGLEKHAKKAKQSLSEYVSNRYAVAEEDNE